MSGDNRICQAYRPLTVNLSDDDVLSPGYISSAVTDDTGLGTAYCPWRLTTKPGQRLNLTLYDFNVLNHDTTSPRCQVS